MLHKSTKECWPKTWLCQIGKYTFFKKGQSQPLLSFNFGFFKQTFQFLQQFNVKKCPSSIRYWDSIPRPLGRESPPITTRPVLPPKYTFLSVWSIRLMVKYFTNLVKIRGIQLSRQKFRWNFFLNIGHRPLFRVFSFFSHSNFNIEIKKSNSIGIQTRGCKMVGAGETTKLWRAPNFSETWVFGFFKGPSPATFSLFFSNKYFCVW